MDSPAMGAVHIYMLVMALYGQSIQRTKLGRANAGIGSQV